MTPATEKRLRKWLREGGSLRLTGFSITGRKDNGVRVTEWLQDRRTLNAAVRRFLDAAEGKDGKR